MTSLTERVYDDVRNEPVVYHRTGYDLHMSSYSDPDRAKGLRGFVTSHDGKLEASIWRDDENPPLYLSKGDFGAGSKWTGTNAFVAAFEEYLQSRGLEK